MLGALYYARTRERAPIYLGIHTVLTGLRWMAAPFAGVLLKKHVFADDARPVFVLSFLVMVVTAFLMMREARDQPRRDPPEEGPMPAPRSTGA